MTWDQKFLGLAKHISTWSKDRSTQVGSVVVGPDKELRSTGYNGFPRGVNDDVEVRHERPLKYMLTSHAEENAILAAARMGLAMKGCCLYLYWPLYGSPCANCARAIIQSGIVRVVGKTGDKDPSLWHERWADSSKVAMEMLLEAGVKFDTIDLE
jgi:dCMP deaminase